jgi:hypothetical protein
MTSSIKSIYGLGTIAVFLKYISDENTELRNKNQMPLTFSDYSNATMTGAVSAYIPAILWPITAFGYVSSMFRQN